jgi:hypothetical protein
MYKTAKAAVVLCRKGIRVSYAFLTSSKSTISYYKDHLILAAAAENVAL